MLYTLQSSNCGPRQARTGPAGYREIPGEPVGRQKYYDILFFLAIDVINYDEKTKLFIKGCYGQTSQTKNRKN